MVPQQFVPIDVSGVHADHRMVHQQVDVEIGDADSLSDSAVGLPKVDTTARADYEAVQVNPARAEVPVGSRSSRESLSSSLS
jgi:hypothetical protein